MRILISNDDGYKAAGIHALAKVMDLFGEVIVVAPKYHQSAMSTAVSLGVKQLAFKALPEERPGRWYYLDATPASCVKFGLQYLYEARNPDLVVGGVNHGSNASTGSNYSATLGVVEEAAINGIKAIGVSIDSHKAGVDFSAVEQLLPEIVGKLLDAWPADHPGLYYNINFPELPADAIKGVRWARQGKGHWIKEFEEWNEERLSELGLTDVFLWQQQRVQLDPGEKAFFMKGDFVNDDANADGLADHLLVKDGWITIVPCQADPTDHTILSAHL